MSFLNLSVTYKNKGSAARALICCAVCLALLAPSAFAAEEQLEMTLEAEKTFVYPGELITLMLKLENKSSEPYYRVDVECEGFSGLGSKIGTLKPGKEYVFPVTIELKSAATFKYLLTSFTPAGKRVMLTSNELTVFVCPAASDVKLRVEAETVSAGIKAPGDVIFNIKLFNDGELELRNVLLSEVTRGEIREFSYVPAGEMPGLTQGYTVSGDAVFQFVAAVVDPSGETAYACSEPLYIDMAAPAGALARDIPDFITDSAPIKEKLILSVYIAGGAFIILSALYLISGWQNRFKRRKVRL